LHEIHADAHLRELITMGIQYYVSVSEEKVEDHFFATDGPTNIMTLSLQGCREWPVQYFLTFRQ
jgi:hypothetical protein